MLRSRPVLSLRVHTLSLIAVLGGGVAACGSEAAIRPNPIATNPKPDAGSHQPDTTGSGGAADAAADAAAPPHCNIPHQTHASPTVDFESLKARVVDPEGKPVATTLAQACGENVCLPGQTDAAGVIDIENPQPLQGGAFKYGDGLRYAQFALALSSEPDHELGDQITVAFPELQGADTIQPGHTHRSSGTSLTLKADTALHIDLLAFPNAEQHVFLAQVLTSDHFPETAQVTPPFSVLWALAPLKTQFCPPAQLVVPNTTDLAAGSAVEFVLHSTDVSGAWAPYTEWGRSATGHVSADGKSIQTDSGSGIGQLGVLGIRALP